MFLVSRYSSPARQSASGYTAIMNSVVGQRVASRCYCWRLPARNLLSEPAHWRPARFHEPALRRSARTTEIRDQTPRWALGSPGTSHCPAIL